MANHAHTSRNKLSRSENLRRRQLAAGQANNQQAGWEEGGISSDFKGGKGEQRRAAAAVANLKDSNGRRQRAVASRGQV